MGVVVVIAGAAWVLVKGYRKLLASNVNTEAVIFGLKQQAAVIAVLAACVFTLLTALQDGKAMLTSLSTVAGAAGAAAAAAGQRFGGPGNVTLAEQAIAGARTPAQ